MQSSDMLSWREDAPCQSVLSLYFIALGQLSICTVTAKGLELCGTPPASPGELAFIHTGGSGGPGTHEQAP